MDRLQALDGGKFWKLWGLREILRTLKSSGNTEISEDFESFKDSEYSEEPEEFQNSSGCTSILTPNDLEMRKTPRSRLVSCLPVYPGEGKEISSNDSNEITDFTLSN